MEHSDQIAYGTWGYNCTHASFCLVLKETKNAALLMEIPNLIVDGDDQVGVALPDLTPNAIDRLSGDNVFRAQKSVSGGTGEIGYHGIHRYYTKWDHKPKRYNTMD